MRQTSTFYGKALIDGQGCVFPATRTGEPGLDGTLVRGPLIPHYDQIVARFPDTVPGNQAAAALERRLTRAAMPYPAPTARATVGALTRPDVSLVCD